MRENTDQAEPMFSTQDFVMALFKVVVGLAHGAGQDFRVRVESGRGDFIWVDSRISAADGVEWVTSEAAAPRLVALPESASAPA
jgi:hypothetical protein